MADASNLTPDIAFDTLKSNTLEAIKSYFPFDGKHRQIHVANLHVDDKLDTDDVTSQAEARDKEGTWGVPIKADIKLVDKLTGKTIDEKKGAIIARLPKLTNRYGFIVGGNEYQVDHLFRLKSGIYARVQENGDLESEFNLAHSPTGRNFSIKLDGQNKRFTVKYGDAHIPLYPLMKSMGVSDEQMEQQWGREIFSANHPKTDAKFRASLASFVKRTSDAENVDTHSTDELHKQVRNFFDQTSLRPDTTKLTLGKAYTSVNGEVLSRAAQKLLGVSRGTEKPDDRDSLAFKEVVSVEDFVPEKIQRSAKTIRSRLRQTVDKKSSVGEILSSDLFNRPIHEFFTKGGSVAERSDQTNPIQMLSAHRKTTLMSREFGGIKSDMSITPDMRGVNQSHIGFLDPMHTPESEKTGITLHLSANARKNGRDLEIPVYDLETKKPVWVKAPDFHNSMAILPDQVTWKNGVPTPIAKEVKVKAVGGEILVKPADSARYVMPSAKGMWNYSSNLIPFLPTDNGNRLMMADKQMEQAISLKHREAPLVQSKTDHPTDPSHTFEKFIGHFVATKSPVSGTMVGSKGDALIIKDDAGKKHEVHLYNHFALNDPKGMMHSEPLVKPGDKVRKGQVVADNNYTKDGALAVGTNLQIGYLPYKGYNFEDGIVISESAAQKLTSEHLYKKALEIDPDHDHISTAKFKAYSVVKASQMTPEQWGLLDENGVVKPGSKILPGQVLIAAVGKNETRRLSPLAGYGKRAFQPFKDKSLTWDEDHVGIVTKVIPISGGRGYRVHVKTEEPAVVGDKLAGRHGNKGIITQILPDHEMPFTKDGEERKPLQVLLNPSGIPTRLNPGQMLETLAGKIAQKIGKPYVVNNFGSAVSDYRTGIEHELKAHGIPDEEMVFDPKDTRRPLGSVAVGPQYILKLKHQVEKKLTARGGGTSVEGKRLSSDIDHQPPKGSGVPGGGQGFGALEMYGLLGHNARHNIREMATYKSDAQDIPFWNMIQEGHEPPPPKAPFSYHKFTALLNGLGVNVTKEGTNVRLMPMTSKEVLQLAGNGRNEITAGAKTIRSKDLKPEPGGLFDPHITGGIDGKQWSFLRLAEPVPNPIFVGAGNKPGPVPVLLGLKMKELDEVMHGKRELHSKTGGAAIEEALKKVDVDSSIEALRKDLPTLTGSALDRSNKKLKYLQALKSVGMKPSDAYILKYLPVLPPTFRPATTTPTGDVNYAPLNGLYKNISLINDELKNFDYKTFSAEHAHPLRTQLWDAMKALQSVGDYRPVYDTDSSGNRALKGILDTIGGGEGEQPKEGYFQAKLVKRRQNLSIRSTVVPEPALGIDQVGIPKGAAMEMYKPFVVAQLHKWGLDPLSAQKEMQKNTPLSHKALQAVVDERPILLKRDPVLHKFGIMAFKPKLVEGKAIQIHPLVCGGFNADFDGDTMAGTIPMSREAVEEAKKLLPSNNLFSPTTGGVMYVPGHESLLGLHLLSQWGKDTGKTFKSVGDLEKAVERDGHVGMNDVVHVGGFKKPTTLGRIMIEARLPRGFAGREQLLHDPKYEITKKTLKGDIATKVAKEHTKDFSKTIDALKDLGNDQSFQYGFSVGLKDFKTLPERDKIVADAQAKVKKIKAQNMGEDHERDDIIKVWTDATTKIDEAQKNLVGKGNRLARMVLAGARGEPEQLRQMLAAPILVEDSSGRTLVTPLTRSYAEGFDVGDFWIAQHGARKGIIQKNRGTAEPGAISKDIINASMSTLIVDQDCKTQQGVLLGLNDKDIHDRFLATAYKTKDGHSIPAGTLIDPGVLSRLKNSKHERVLVRSPMKCAHGSGICAKCYGLNEAGVLHDVGTNIGVLASQAMGEPSTQLSMKAFHSGGVAQGAGAKSLDAITRFRNLLEMPKKLKDEAILALETGRITDIKKDAVGGHDVFINGVRHWVPTHLIDPNVKVGNEVRKGQMLSGGYVNPHRMLEATKDIHAVQNFLTDELHGGLFGDFGVRKRNVEVAVRSMTNLTKVTDPGSSDWAHGDIVPRSIVEEHNRSSHAGHKPVLHQPILRGTGEIPLVGTQDWMQRLNYQRLHDTVQQAASMGHRSDIHSANPIPAMAHGAEFGRPSPGKPKHVY
jgi:DNA-directed RNA polymerase subunit beta'